MMVLPWNGNKLPGKKFYTVGPTEQTLMLKLRTMTKDFFELLQKVRLQQTRFKSKKRF
jgi:hypothetical protein